MAFRRSTQVICLIIFFLSWYFLFLRTRQDGTPSRMRLQANVKTFPAPVRHNRLPPILFPLPRHRPMSNRQHNQGIVEVRSDESSVQKMRQLSYKDMKVREQELRPPTHAKRKKTMSGEFWAKIEHRNERHRAIRSVTSKEVIKQKPAEQIRQTTGDQDLHVAEHNHSKNEVAKFSSEHAEAVVFRANKRWDRELQVAFESAKEEHKVSNQTDQHLETFSHQSVRTGIWNRIQNNETNNAVTDGMATDFATKASLVGKEETEVGLPKHNHAKDSNYSTQPETKYAVMNSKNSTGHSVRTKPVSANYIAGVFSNRTPQGAEDHVIPTTENNNNRAMVTYGTEREENINALLSILQDSTNDINNFRDSANRVKTLASHSTEREGSDNNNILHSVGKTNASSTRETARENSGNTLLTILRYLIRSANNMRRYVTNEKSAEFDTAREITDEDNTLDFISKTYAWATHANARKENDKNSANVAYHNTSDRNDILATHTVTREEDATYNETRKEDSNSASATYFATREEDSINTLATYYETREDNTFPEYYDTSDEDTNNDLATFYDTTAEEGDKEEEDTSNNFIRRLLNQFLTRSLDKREARDSQRPIPQALPSEIRQAMINELRSGRRFSEQRPLGGEVELSCQNEVMQFLKAEVPALKVQWRLNGDPIPIKASRMLFRGDDLMVIQDLMVKDSGVYECRVEFGTQHTMPVAYFALSVTSDVPTLFVRETEPLDLDCHSSALADILYVYDLTLATDPLFGCKPPCMDTNVTHSSFRNWFFSGSRSPLLPEDIPATLNRVDVVESSTKDMSGVWWCQTEHAASQGKWNTSWYRVFIKDPPPAIEIWWKQVLKRPWLVSVLGTLILGSCIAVSILIARWAQKQHENLEIRWQKAKSRMLRRGSQLEQSLSAISQMSGSSKKGGKKKAKADISQGSAQSSQSAQGSFSALEAYHVDDKHRRPASPNIAAELFSKRY